MDTPPKFNIDPEAKWWLEDKPFLLGFGNFSGCFAVKLQVGTFFLKFRVWWLVPLAPLFSTCHAVRTVVELDHGFPLIGMSMKTPPGFLFRTKIIFPKKNVPDFRCLCKFSLKSVEGES